ncbi:MAG: xanthine dehydrogenase family protein subunit M, partial [Alphaproteobacteria bacterium]|nr:xanthine dehydrogenase family protein subunit M [Alphaproteobacteria bacterium]
AAVLETEDDKIKSARIAMGGVAHRPWRAVDAEKQLVGAPANADSFAAAGDAAVKGARGYGHNDFKIALAARTVARALTDAAGQKKG